MTSFDCRWHNMFCGLAPVHLPQKTSWLVTCLISVFIRLIWIVISSPSIFALTCKGTWVTNTVLWWAFIVESLLAFGLLLNCGVHRNYPFRGDCACSWINTWSSFAVVGSGIRLSQLSSLGTLYCKGVWFFCLASLLDVVILIRWCVWIACGWKGYRSLQKTRQALVCCTFVGLIRFKMRVCVRSASQSLDHQCV